MPNPFAARKSPSALFLAALLALPAAAGAARLPEPPAIAAKSYVLVDHDSGQVLAAKEPGLQIGPASLTKLMLLYVAFHELAQGRIKLTDSVLVSEKAWRRGMDSKESRMFIEVGKRVAVEDLLRGVIVQSGNDASIALAEHIAGSEDACAGLMNRYAADLGLTRSHFANATGVPAEGQHTTAADVATLSRALIREFPAMYAMFKEKEFVFNKIRQPNRNRLLWRDPSVDGVKTGHTEAAGYHLAASAVRDGRRLVSVVMGTAGEEPRAQASIALLNFGFRFFENVPVLAANAPAVTVRPWKGTATELALGVARPLVVTVPRGLGARVQVQTRPPDKVFAPVAAGHELGSVTVTLDGEVLREEPLVALAELPEGNLWRRVSDEIELWIRDLL
jgi:serine-type D-Ala-D-Ala carboxypeptidase (penicillin-binding protein 5/6)